MGKVINGDFAIEICQVYNNGFHEALGNKPFMFSSDFHHEVNNDYCRHEIHQIVENDRLADDDKHGVLHRNAELFYGLGVDQRVKASA